MALLLVLNLLGKASVGKLDAFVKKCGLGEVPAPAKHPHIPNPGTVWSDADKKYWIDLYNTLKNASIDGNKIDFGRPGKYMEGNNPESSGFEAVFLTRVLQIKGMLEQKRVDLLEVD